MRIAWWVIGVAACGKQPDVQRPAPTVAHVIAAPSPPAVAVPVPGIRFDRPEPLGLGRRWIADGIDAIAFCPGDAELVVAGHDAVRWISATHGGIVREVAVPGASTIDCRADGAVVAVADDAAVLVTHDGAIARTPPALHVIAARFAIDGSVRVLSEHGYERWTGDASEHLHDVPAQAFLVPGGALAYVRDHALWLRAGATDARIDGWRDGPDDQRAGILARDVTLASDGTVAAVGDYDGAIAWEHRHRVTVVPADVGATGVLANARWFVALDVGHTLWTMRRSDHTYDHLNQPCGSRIDEAASIPMALSHDGKWIALGCGSVVGIRILDVTTLHVVTGRDPQPLVAATWSGDRLATRDEDGRIEVWRDRKIVKRIPTGYDGRALWWWGDDLAGEFGMAAAEMARWSSTTGKRSKPFERGVVRAVQTPDVTLLATWGPDGFAVQRGDVFQQLDYAGHKTVQELSISPGGTRGLAVRRFSPNTISSPEGLQPDLVVLDLVARTTKIVQVDADAVAASDTELAVAHGRSIGHLVGDQLVPFVTAAAPVIALAYSLDGRVLAAGCTDGTIAIYAGAQLVTTLAAHTQPVRRVVWNATQLVSIADDQTLVWTMRLSAR